MWLAFPQLEVFMRNINALGYSLVFILPWVTVLAGFVILLIPRRQNAATQEQIRTPRQAA